MQFNSTLQSHLTRGIVLHVSVLALVLAHQVYSAEESPPGGAEKIFFDEFDSPDPSESAGWYFRGNNLETEQVVQSGDLVLARKDKDLPVSGGSAVWKSFDSVVIDAGQTLRLTIVFSGAEGEKWPYFLISLADSPNTIDAHGDVLNEPPPRYFYGLGLPFGFEPGAGQFIEAAARSIWDQSSYHAAIDLLNLQAETPLQPIFAEPKRGLAPDRYADKAVLVWELHNEDGVMVSRGHWTGPDGSTVPLLELRAGQVQHFDFNKIGIGFMFWDAEWDYGKAVADSVWIDSVKLEKF